MHLLFVTKIIMNYCYNLLSIMYVPDLLIDLDNLYNDRVRYKLLFAIYRFKKSLRSLRNKYSK